MCEEAQEQNLYNEIKMYRYKHTIQAEHLYMVS
jgi:hypothetical protein